MKCLNCNKEPALFVTGRGYLPGKKCQQIPTKKPQKSVEFTTDTIKTQRKAYAPDLIQPWREGELSKEYLEQHGTKGIKVTPEEIAKAEYVWRGDVGDYYS